MYFASRPPVAPGSASVVAPILALTVLGIGEPVAWTATNGRVSRAAPVEFASVAMGARYLTTLGLGGILSGKVGPYVESVGFPAAFAAMTALTGSASAIALA
jgi:hypothetical protein